MSRRTVISIALGVTSVACAAGVFGPPTTTSVEMTPLPDASADGQLGGVVRDQQTSESIEGALVIIQCACLAGHRETQTNADGLFLFRDLPTGIYTVQILAGQADVSHVVEVDKGHRVKVHTALRPRDEMVVT